MKRVIMDTDPGIDDAAAILMTLGSPELDIEAMTTVFGNTPVENCTINVTLSFQNGGTVAVTDIDLRVMVFRQPPGVEIPGYVAGRLDSDVTAGGRTRNQVCGPFPEYDDATECCMTSAQVLQCTTAINTFNLNAIGEGALEA